MINAATTTHWAAFLIARAPLARIRITQHTWRARPKAPSLSKGPGFSLRWREWRCLEQTSWLLLSKWEYCDIGPFDNAKLFPRLLVSLHTVGMEEKNRRLSFLTPPPLWIEFRGDFFAGFLQAPSLFDHRRLPIYGLYVYSFCKCKVIRVEMVRIRSEESTRCIIFICHRVTPPPPSPNNEVACLLTAAYLATQNTKHNSHLWFHLLPVRAA